MSGTKGRSGTCAVNDHTTREARRLAGAKGGLSKGMPAARGVAKGDPKAIAELGARAEEMGRMAAKLGGSDAAQGEHMPVPRWFAPMIQRVQSGEMMPVDLVATLNAGIAAWKVVGAKVEHDHEAGTLLTAEQAEELTMQIIDAFKAKLADSVRCIFREFVPAHQGNAAEAKLAEAVRAAMGAAAERAVAVRRSL